MKCDIFKLALLPLFFLIAPLGANTPDVEGFCPPSLSKIVWKVGVDLLIFRPYIENLPYCNGYTLQHVFITTLATPVVPDYTIYSGKIQGLQKRVPSRFSPGFRLKCGGYSSDWKGETSLQWTHFHSSNKEASQGRMSNLNNGTFLKFSPSLINFGSSIGKTYPSITESPLSGASGSWSLDFDQGDLLISKKLYLYPNLFLEPILGLSGIKIKQKWINNGIQHDLLPSNSPSSGNILANTAEFFHNESSRFQGIGGKTGCISSWHLFEGFHLVGLITGALYWGEFDVKQEAFEILHTSGIEESPASNRYLANIQKTDHNRFQDVRFASTLGIGLVYTFAFHYEKNQGCLRLLWEGHWFPSQNIFGATQLIGTIQDLPTDTLLGNVDNSTLSKSPGGDLSFQGCVLSIDISF